MDNELKKIIKGCGSGKRDAQHKLYQLYQRKMFGICLHYAKDKTEAEDIAQEGFLKVFENIKQYKFKGSFDGWIKRIMINTALERFRRQKFLYLVDDMTVYDEEQEYDVIGDSIEAGELLGLVQELSPQYRTIFSLYAIEGYSHQEISEMLDISVGTSKSNLSRARTILKDKVEEKYSEIINNNRKKA